MIYLLSVNSDSWDTYLVLKINQILSSADFYITKQFVAWKLCILRSYIFAW